MSRMVMGTIYHSSFVLMVSRSKFMDKHFDILGSNVKINVIPYCHCMSIRFSLPLCLPMARVFDYTQ